MRGGGIFHAKGNDFSLIYFLQLNEKVPAQIATLFWFVISINNNVTMLFDDDDDVCFLGTLKKDS